MTVLIIDDHADFRSAARRLLESGGLRVIGEAGDIASGRAAVRELQPSVVLLDIQLPDGDGIDAVELMRREAPGSEVVLISSRAGGVYGERIATSSARGFITKGELSAARVLEVLGG